MTEAWMVRSGQQQRFIENLIRQFHDEVEKLIDELDDLDFEELERKSVEVRDVFTRNLLIEILLYPNSQSDDGLFSNRAKKFWHEIVGARIKEFSRAPEETKVLAWRFFIEVAKSSSNKFESALSRLEHMNPQKLFHASSAMSEVEIED